MGIFKGIPQLMKELQKIRASVCEDVSRIPQNSDVHIVSESSRCFVIKSSAVLGRPLCPSYYDFEESTKLICARLEKVNIENLEKELTDIVTKGSVLYVQQTTNNSWVSASRRVNLHPRVIEHLRTFLPVKEEENNIK